MLAATTIRATTPAAAAATSGANHRRAGAGIAWPVAAEPGMLLSVSSWRR